MKREVMAAVIENALMEFQIQYCGMTRLNLSAKAAGVILSMAIENKEKKDAISECMETERDNKLC